MGTKNGFLILWTVVGVILLYLGAQDAFRWAGDAEAIRMGLTWADSFLPHGIVALLTAAGFLIKHHVGRWISLGGAIVFGLYYVAYLIFGGEGAFHLRVVVPVLLLTLVTGTLNFIRKERGHAQHNKEKSGSE
jgi:hypothetical protein